MLNTAPPATSTPLATTSDRNVVTALDPFNTVIETSTDPSPRVLARPAYSAFVATRRPTTVTDNPLWFGNGLAATPTRRSVSLLDTAANDAARVSPGCCSTNDAAPDDTEKLDAAPLTVHAPPTSALPRPPDTDRSTPSAASTADESGDAVTLTSWLTVAVAPGPPVTASVTGYVPAAALECWLVVAAVVTTPSPQSHLPRLIDPPGAVEADPSAEQLRVVHRAVKAASGASTPRSRCRGPVGRPRPRPAGQPEGVLDRPQDAGVVDALGVPTRLHPLTEDQGGDLVARRAARRRARPRRDPGVRQFGGA